ncbi:DoxX family protein [Membranihabitans maritimus]|uniref:DoxX family protein n=1 Tax=Membranihabitans maritimus TaxID=2904244 RepID=UPI001F402CB0|nr:DoxX family membrane protein [Membranihabitans maritimus]
MNTYSYLILRLSVGMSMLGHGFVRIFKLKAFSDGMVSNFEESMLPEIIVLPFSYVLPFAELIVGILLIIGLWTRKALVTGGFIMVILIFGSSMIENWGAIPSQLIHSAFFALLLHYLGDDTLSIDSWQDQ